MLNHVERGRILEQPAGKHLAPSQLAFRIGPFFDKDLNEGPRFRRTLPGQGPLTGGKPHHDIPDPPRFARFQDNILRDVVALVEQAQRRDAVLDRGAVFAFHCRRGSLRGNGLGNVGCRRIWLSAAAACSKQQGRAKRESPPHDQASGLQAS